MNASTPRRQNMVSAIRSRGASAPGGSLFDCRREALGILSAEEPTATGMRIERADAHMGRAHAKPPQSRNLWPQFLAAIPGSNPPKHPRGRN
jgi:hypothetical protein